MERFHDRTVLVTGAGSGLGRACVLRVAEEGADIIAVDLGERGCEQVASEVKTLGRRCLALCVDVTDPVAVQRMIELAVKEFGAIWGAVNSAGRASRAMPVGDYDEQLWSSIIDLNLNGLFFCNKYELAHMAEQRRGAIVNVSSIAGIHGTVIGLGAYAASKHGVIGLTKAAARDYAAIGVRVNALCPGPMLTPLARAHYDQHPGSEEEAMTRIPMHRIASPEEVAGAVAFLLSDDASFVTGHALVADGGATI